MAFLEGFLFGLGMLVFIGPVFFYLIKTTIESGFWAGIMVAISIVLGDLLCIILCSFGAIPFFENQENKFWIGIAGGAILVGLGMKYIFQPNVCLDTMAGSKNTADSYLGYFVQGFLVNFVNPFVFAVWIGVIGHAQTKYGTNVQLLQFLFAALLGIFVTDVAKVFFAEKIKKVIKDTFLIKLYRVIGILLTIFGLRLFIAVF